MSKTRRHVRRAKSIQRTLTVAFIKKQFRKRHGRNAIARIVLDKRFAYRPGATRLTMSHKQPHRRHQELPLVCSHCFFGGLSWKTVTMIFSY